MQKGSTNRGGGQDRSKIAGGGKYEVNYEAKKTGTAGAGKKAAKSAGNSRT